MTQTPPSGNQTSSALARASLPEGHEDRRYIPMIQGEIDRIAALISRMTRLYIPLVESPRACALAECARETVALRAEACHEKNDRCAGIGRAPGGTPAPV